MIRTILAVTLVFGLGGAAAADPMHRHENKIDRHTFPVTSTYGFNVDKCMYAHGRESGLCEATKDQDGNYIPISLPHGIGRTSHTAPAARMICDDQGYKFEDGWLADATVKKVKDHGKWAYINADGEMVFIDDPQTGWFDALDQVSCHRLRIVVVTVPHDTPEHPPHD